MNGVKKLAYGVVFAVAALGAASAWATSDYYVGVEYIGSDGNQYIDTIWTNGSSHVVTLNIQPTAVPTTDGSGAGGSMTYYGCRTSYQSQNITMFIDFANNTPSFNLDFNNGDYSTYRHIAGNVSTDYRYVLVNSAAERTVTAYDASGDVVDSSSDDDNCAATFSCAGSAYLFAINDMSGGSPAFLWTNKAKMKFYGATVDTVGGEQCCNLVPCLKNGSEPGVYDTVRDLFLTNSGSGSFTYGAATGIVYGDDPGGDTPAPAGRLPAGYEEVTSIIVTDVRQYIDTGYKPNVTTDVEGHFYVPNFNDTTTLYWTRLGSAYNYCAYGFVFPANADTLGKIRVYRFSAGTAQTDFPSDSITHDIWISTEYSNGGTVNSYTLNEHTLNFAAKAIDSIDYSIYLFRLNDVGTVNVNAVVGMKLYSFKILENRVPVKDFVPCRRASDGAVGLYDVLEEDKRKAFYKNPTGTGGNFDYEILTPGPVLDPPEISNLTSTNALVSGSVSSFGAGATSADVRFVYTDGATTNSVAIGTMSSGQSSFSKLVGGLASATDFTCWFTATNNASVPVAADSAAVSFRTRTLPTGGQHAVGLYFPRAPEAALADFPVLVRVSEDNVDGFSYAYCPTATNIWFTDANDEALPFDVDTWNPAGESLFWVSVPSFSSAATVTLHWSDDISDAPASPASSQVWSRANYVGVWHMNELVYDPVKEKHYTPDASASGWNAYKVTQTDAVPAPVTNATGVTANPTPPTGTAMNIAYGAGKDNTSYGGFCVPMAQTASFTLGGSGFTLSGIVNSQQKANNGRCRVIAFGDAYNDMANFAVGSDSIYCMAGTQTSISWDHTKGSTDWVFAADVFSTTSQIYSDGIPRHPGNSNVNLTGITLTKGIGLGCFINGKNTVDGYIDEARIRNAVSSAAWIAAEYATVTDPDYVSFGAAPAPAVLPAGFTQCSYIVVTNRNQYINTRCAPGLSTDIQAHFEVPDFSTQNVLYWARNSQTIDHGFILEANADSTKKVRAYRLSNGKNTNVTQLQNQPVKTEMFLSTEYRDMTHNTFTLNGETARFVQWEVESDPSIFLFRLNNNGVVYADTGARVGMKLYSFKILEGGVVKKEFVPCVRDSDFVAGLYDVREPDPELAFYTNNGDGGSFGYEVLSLVPVLSAPEVSGIFSTNAVVTCDVLALGAGATSADVYFVYTDGATTNSVAIGTATSAPSTLAAPVAGFAPQTSYTCWFAATNDAAAASSVSAAAVFTTKRLPFDGEKSCELTFPNGPAEALADFPVLVRISEAGLDGFEYVDCPSGECLWFTDEYRVALPFEVDTWNPDGESLVWVSVPQFSRDTVIAMHWSENRGDVPASPAAAQVWKRAGYNAVWHFSGDAAESATNLSVSATIGAPTYVASAGGIGKALWLDGASTLSYSNDAAWATLGANNSLTITLLARPDLVVLNTHARMVSCAASWLEKNGYTFAAHNPKDRIVLSSSDSSEIYLETSEWSGWPANSWVHLAGVYDNTTGKIFVDGVVKKTGSIKKVYTPQNALYLGANGDGAQRFWPGGLDEIRIRAAASTPEWVAEEYATVTDAGYVAFGEVVEGDVSDVLRVGGLEILDAAATDVAVEGAVMSLGQGASSANVYLVCTDGATTNRTLIGTASSAPQTVRARVGGLASRTAYTCWLEAVNNAAPPAGAKSSAREFKTDYALPANYTRLEYIQSDGTSGYISTDLYPDPQADTIELEVALAGSVTTYQSLFMCRAADNSNPWGVILRPSNAGWRYDYSTSGADVSDAWISQHVGVRTTLVAVTNVFSTSYGKVVTDTANPSFTAVGGPMLVFVTNGSTVGNYGRFKLYSLRVYRAGALINDFVPVLDDQGNPTLWDACGGDVEVVPHGTLLYSLPALSVVVEDIPVQRYRSGRACEPHPVVRDVGGAVLREGVDYSLAWASNTVVGVGAVVVTGLGQNAGRQARAEFGIVARLPAGYREVEYVHSSGAQYVDTGFMPNELTRADFRFTIYDHATDGVYSVPFGARNGNTKQFFTGITPRNAGKKYVFSRHGEGATDLNGCDGYRGIDNLAGKPVPTGHHVFSLNQNVYNLDGYVYTFKSPAQLQFSCDCTAYVFASQNSASDPTLALPSIMDLYWLKIWDNGVLVRDFVPCVRTVGGVETVGLYDVRPNAVKHFYENGGTGALTAGPDSPTLPVVGSVYYLR